MKLYVDDIRPVPDGWTLARTIDSAVRFVSMFGNEITHISLDHDISHQVTVGGTSRPYPCAETFVAVALFISYYYIYEDDKTKKPTITIHTSNPSGASKMATILQDFNTFIAPSKPANRLENEV